MDDELWNEAEELEAVGYSDRYDVEFRIEKLSRWILFKAYNQEEEILAGHIRPDGCSEWFWDEHLCHYYQLWDICRLIIWIADRIKTKYMIGVWGDE